MRQKLLLENGGLLLLEDGGALELEQEIADAVATSPYGGGGVPAYHTPIPLRRRRRVTGLESPAALADVAAQHRRDRELDDEEALLMLLGDGG